MANVLENHITFGSIPVTLSQIETFLKSTTSGAQVIFQGVVRGDTLKEGDVVKAIEYEGIEGMIISEVEKIAQQLSEELKIEKFYFHHLLGLVPVGEPSIFIGIAGGHRKEVFQALDLAMDNIKRTVPIFKKEIGHTNSQWK
ncbi:MAG: molybdopterin converting factor subunit 2 [Bacteroidota bacterium]